MTAAAFDPRFDALEIPGKILAGRPQPTWAQDVLDLPARVLLDLPVPPRLGLHVLGVEGVVRIGGDIRPDAEVGFDREEWRALVVATEADRVWPHDFTRFCQLKAAGSHPLGLTEALAGAQPDLQEEWSLRAVLERLGVELLSIDLD